MADTYTPFTTNKALDNIGNTADTSNMGMSTSLAAGVNPLSLSTEDWTKKLMQQYYDQGNQTFLGMDKTQLQGVQGLAGIGTSLAGLYFDWQNNKRADKAMKLHEQDRNAQYASNSKWNQGIAASGLGTATRAVV